MNACRILLVAYQCAPGMGSVSQIGWEWYSRLCKNNAVTLVTHVRNRAALSAAGAPCPGSEIIYIDTEWFAAPLYRTAKRLFPRSEHSVFLVSSLDYFVFDFAAYRLLRQRLAAGAAWGVLHRVTPVTLAAPTWLSRLNLPTVVGPLNSGLNDPQAFRQQVRQESTWLSKARTLGRALDRALGSSRRAARILTASRATLEAVAPQYRHRCRMMLENGVDLQRFSPSPWPAAPNIQNPLKILFVGRLVAVKGLDLLLQAVAQLKQAGVLVHLEVVGDGPMRAPWQAQSRALQLTEEVNFHGAASQEVVAEKMRDCHVFCLPSVRESGGAVLLEAMASARPVIALNFGGPAEIVSERIGALLAMESPEQVVSSLFASLLDVTRNPGVWRQRGHNGRREVEARHSWPAKITTAQALYGELLAERSLSCC